LTPEVTTAQLIHLFYDSPADLGRLELVTEEQTPRAYRTLLAHDQHMTVTVEDWHRSEINLSVLSTRITKSHYSRKIVLTRRVDAAPVQFGIVRLKFDYLPRRVRQEIQAHQTPLGRILIQHDVLRRVERQALWKVEAGAELSRLLGQVDCVGTYGRTAMIHCNGEPAIEVLEIVAPVDRPDRDRAGPGPLGS
jgi:chorismate-pyruvate lyase